MPKITEAEALRRFRELESDLAHIKATLAATPAAPELFPLIKDARRRLYNLQRNAVMKAAA